MAIFRGNFMYLVEVDLLRKGFYSCHYEPYCRLLFSLIINDLSETKNLYDVVNTIKKIVEQQVKISNLVASLRLTDSKLLSIEMGREETNNRTLRCDWVPYATCRFVNPKEYE